MKATIAAAFLWSELFRCGGYGRQHPLSIPRVPLTFDLIRCYGAIEPGEIVTARKAANDELAAFHAPDYVAAYAQAELRGRVEAHERARYGLGTLENPYFERFFTLPATAAGASIQAAGEVLRGRTAFNPAGGMHHARAGRAEGFCFLNDPVLGILILRQAGWRVLYVDIDAHHGDGVELAFRDDPEVMTLSLHMDAAYAYPFGGGAFADQGSAADGYTTMNIPLPQGMHDAEYRMVFDAAWQPVVARFRPDAIVLQAGADALFCDPLARFRLTIQGFLDVVRQILESAPRHADGTPRVLALGGGGYHPVATARAWCGLWGLLSGRELPPEIPPAGAARLHESGWDLDEDEDYFPRLFESRLDARSDLPVRAVVRALVAAIPTHRFFSHR